MASDGGIDERAERAEREGASAVRRAEIALHVAEENERLAREWVSAAKRIGARQVAQVEQLRRDAEHAKHEAVRRSMTAEDQADALVDEARRLAKNANEAELAAQAALSRADASGGDPATRRHLQREAEEAKERTRVAEGGVEEAEQQAREQVERALRDVEVALEQVRRVDAEEEEIYGDESAAFLLGLQGMEASPWLLDSFDERTPGVVRAALARLEWTKEATQRARQELVEARKWARELIAQAARGNDDVPEDRLAPRLSELQTVGRGRAEGVSGTAREYEAIKRRLSPLDRTRSGRRVRADGGGETKKARGRQRPRAAGESKDGTAP